MSWSDTELVEIRQARRGDRLGSGTFARVDIPAGTIVGVFSGEITRFQKSEKQVEFGGANLHMMLELYEDETQMIVLALTDLEQPVNRINHSCNPNCALTGIHGLTMVANRDIGANEELTFDYRPITFYPIGVPCWCENSRCVL